MPAAEPLRILIIKLGALGDFIQALGPFAAIRRHHADAHITLLTTDPFAAFAAASATARFAFSPATARFAVATTSVFSLASSCPGK